MDPSAFLMVLLQRPVVDEKWEEEAEVPKQQ
jgi:hypothetical protein